MNEPAERQITSVVFDLGNVLVRWDPYLPLSDRLSRDEWQQYADAVGFFELNALADQGTPLAEIVSRAKERSRSGGELVETYFAEFERSLAGPVPGSADIVRTLQTDGVRTLGLTNWSTETFHHASQAAPVIDELEAVMVSGREGLAKPDPRIFHALVETHALTPPETVFIDDSLRNVEAAEELGFTVVHFTDASQLRDDLQQLRVLS